MSRENTKGPFKYYVSKEVGGWGGQLLMFADKVGGWGWPNADVSKKSKENHFSDSKLSVFSGKNNPELLCTSQQK